MLDDVIIVGVPDGQPIHLLAVHADFEPLSQLDVHSADTRQTLIK